ncbi:glycosyltransferase family 4 protein, partial [bacterium]|nr:glycosyltransferase family 4 protein [bacterium]
MRIFYLITKSETGGAQTHIWQLSKYFIGKGFKIGVMSYPGGWLEKEVKKLGVKFYPNYFLSNSVNPIQDLKAMKEIKKAIKDFKPDLVSCHSTKAGFLGRLAIRNKIPTIFTAHGWAFTEGTPFLRKRLAILIERIAGEFCSKIICVSKFDKELALKYKIASPNKLVVIHNGVEVEKAKNQKSEVKGLEKKIRIVFVGRLAKQKDPLLLLRAFYNLSPELKNKAEISIIGEGPKRKGLEKFIKESKLEKEVKLLGGISREKVFEVLKKSDIFVLISNWEGFPRSILEAMSCGLPVIASDVGGIKEAVDENCGILVKRGDKEGIKNALERLIKNSSLIRKMGEKAKERVEKKFSLDKML